MRDKNKVFLMGRLGADPVQRSTKNGVAVANFSVATSRWVKDDATDSGKAEETQWHRIVAWGREAEMCARHLRKGFPVMIEGSIPSRQYEKDGVMRTTVEVHADDVSFLPTGKRNSVAEEASPSVAQA